MVSSKVQKVGSIIESLGTMELTSLLTIAVTFSLLKRLFPTFWIADLNSALPF
jgi:hypothetical protein